MEETRRYNVTLIGLGARGYKAWFEYLQKSPSLRVSGVCDTNEATIATFVSRHPKISTYTSLAELLKEQKPDFAVVSVPNRFHSQCIAQLSSAGIPVLKEKPAAETTAEFQELCEYPVKIGVAFQRRWQKRFVHFKNFLPSVGKVLSVRATLVGKYNPPTDGWRVMDNVGTFEDLGVHILDIIVWLFGKPSSLQGYRVNDGPPGARDRESHVCMRWDDSGIVAHLYVSEVALGKEESIAVRGTLGSLHLAGNEITQLSTQGKENFKMTVQSSKQEAVQDMCKDFGDYVTGVANSFSTSIKEMADSLATVEAVRASFLSSKLETVTSPLSQPPNAHANSKKSDTGALLNIADKKFLLNTGDKIPALGFGTRKPKKPKQVYEAVGKALEMGYRHIDTAFRYNNEDQVGEAVRDSGIPRKDIWITTKVDNSWHHRVLESVDGSLAALGMDYVDLLLMHWPCPVSPDDPKKSLAGWNFIKTWEDMQRAVQSGKVRNIGVSNFGIRNLKKLLSHPTCQIVPAVNQIELHPCCPAKNLIEFCKQQGIHCTAYSPLAAGLTQLYEHPVLVDLSRRKSKTPQQILIRWGLQRGTSVIPKSVTPDRIAANYDQAGWSLSTEEQDLLENLGVKFRVYPDDWLPETAYLDEDDKLRHRL